jgi:serine protease Do
VRLRVERLETADTAASTSAPADTGFGMSLRDIDPGVRRQLQLPSSRQGVLVTEVEERSPAARVGIRAGDVILEVNRRAVVNASEAAAALRREPEQGTAFVLLWRQGQEQFVVLTRD